MPKGQLSLEYLILLAAFLSFLLFLLPYLNTIYHLGIFSADVKNAENFLQSFANSASSLSILGEGLEQSISARILTGWEIYAEGNELFVVVRSSELDKTKQLSTALNTEISMPRLEKEGELDLKLIKNGSSILVESNSYSQQMHPSQAE